MMTKGELAEVAAAKRLSERNAERDYLLELVMYSLSGSGDSLAFKGGTALYKFHNLNRFSEDLDFTIGARRFSVERAVERTIRDSAAIGITGTIEEMRSYRNECNVRLMFCGPLYDGRKESLTRITINLSSRERPQMVERLLLIPSYKEIPAFELYVLDPRELLAEKVRAIMTRSKPRDVYDLWFLLKKGVPIDIDLINRKLKVASLRFEKGRFGRALEGKRGMWSKDLKMLIVGRMPEFEVALREIMAQFQGSI